MNVYEEEDVAMQIDEGNLTNRTFDDRDSRWNENVCKFLGRLGWSYGTNPMRFGKPSKNSYMVKDDRSVTLLTAHFMGTYTEVKVQTVGKEFRGYQDL
tara:strand:+ start:63 stop:356 length:294 start_codon:yes stop_codon:yes gene_type:complete